MTKRIFLTGASGYVGGEVLYQLARLSNPSSPAVRCLDRDAANTRSIRQAFPNVTIVDGCLDDSALIRQEAAAADVVLHLADTKHVASAQAIATGRPKAWVQLTTATIYTRDEMATGRLGEPSKDRYADVADGSRILKLLQENPDCTIEQTVLAQKRSEMRTALVVAPLIYGQGRGPCQTSSRHVPEIARLTLELDHGIQILQGQNRWSNVHVADAARLICLLAEAATAHSDVGWNEEGVYHAENGAMSFGALNARITSEAVKQGLLNKNRVAVIDGKRANELSPHLAMLCGTNAVMMAQRARQRLGWTPSCQSLADHIPDAVRIEGESLRR